MNPEKVEKMMKHGARYGMTPAALGKMLASPPHNLTPVEATAIMDRYRQAYPQLSSITALMNKDCKAMARKEPPEKQGVRNVRAYKKLLTPAPFPAGGGSEFREVSPASVLAQSGVPESPAPAKSLALINRSAVKALALEISKTTRAGKFERVAGSFIDGVEADLDALIRGLSKSTEAAPRNYVTGNAIRAVRERLDQAVVAIVKSRVHRHPSIGKTLTA